jgi:hypothetical protein
MNKKFLAETGTRSKFITPGFLRVRTWDAGRGPGFDDPGAGGCLFHRIRAGNRV